MSLRTTTLLIVIMIFIGLVSLLVFNLQTNLSSHFSGLEKQSATLMVDRARGVFDLELESLNLIAQEWSNRPDVIAYFKSNGSAQKPVLLSNECTPDYSVNIALLVDPQEHVSDTVSCQGASLPRLGSSFSTRLTSHSGFLKLSGGPIIVSGAPIGKTGAWVFAGRQVDNNMLERINSRFKISVSLISGDSTNLSPEIRSAVASLTQAGTSTILPLDDNNLSAFLLFNDIYGKPAYFLQITQPRIIYYSGLLVTNYLMIFLVTSSFIFGLIIIILLERLVLSRLTRLSREVSQIGQSGDFSHRVTLLYNDELTQLGKDINSMLADLNQRMHELQILYDVSQEFLGKLNTGTILTSVCELAVQKMGLATAWIGQLRSDDFKLIATAASGCDVRDLPGLPVNCSSKDQPLPCQAFCQEELIFQSTSSVNGHLSSEAAIPLKTGNENEAVLVITSQSENYFTAPRRSHLLAFTNQARLAMQSARYYEESKTARRRLELLSHRLVQVQEEERQFIAQELHDEIGQELTGLRLILETGAAQPEKLKEAHQIVTELIGRVRQISLDLRPAMLDDLGLLPALIWLINRFTSQTGIQVDFVHFNLEDRRFTNEIEITAYRVVQESLTNAARYAQVSSVEVRVWTTEQDLMLQISDHGVGFDFDSTIRQREGRGLLGMRERVNFLNGNLFIETRPNEGTSISAKLPIYPVGGEK